MTRRFAWALALCLVAALALPGIASARDRDRAGDFDFWLLTLSWSPSWCEATAHRPDEPQCARPFAFVVHGLWPQFDRGWPADCPTTRPGPSAADVDATLDVMPSPGLIRHEWRKHGTCSGLDGRSYLNVIRRLYEKIRIPDAFREPREDRMVAVRDVEKAFRAANPGLDADEIAVTCDGRRLREVRICLKKDLSAFTACPEVQRSACRTDRVYVPAVRTGSAR